MGSCQALRRRVELMADSIDLQLVNLGLKEAPPAALVALASKLS